jgi:hypothetical protein
LLAARLEQRPQVGCAALLSAGVTAYKPHHCGGRTKVRPFASLEFALIAGQKTFSLAHA